MNKEFENIDQEDLMVDREFDIAIIGMSGRFPMAKTVDEYWENLKNGKECFTDLTDEQIIASGVDPEMLKDPHYVKRSPVLEDYDKFDPFFFGYTPREVSLMDPQQRLFLECSWEAFEDAGYDAHRYNEPVGVFGGSAINTYMIFSGAHNRFYSEFLPSVVGNDMSFLANRVSYQLNLNGPAVTVQTACSTSLVSVHLSIQSLLNDECSMALAGGVAMWVPHESGHLYKEGSVFTKDGHCRTFDAKATGTIFGSGAGVVLLKRFEDAVRDKDHIYAVIKGSAVNNDGAKKTDYTAPSVDGQAEVIVEALANSGLSAEDISYVETHGTGTFIGDPIEIRALTKAYRAFTDKKGFCGIGSVKPNIGHLDAAAGVSGLIKTVMAMNHKMLPPSINFDEPNPAIDFENSPFFVNDTLREWKGIDGQPLRAGITSLGMGGTNAHVILEEAPVINRPKKDPAGPQLITFSAKKEAALDEYSDKFAEYLKNNPDVDLEDIAHTLHTGRKEFDVRRFVSVTDRDDAISVLEKINRSRVKTFSDVRKDREVVFMFPGQGSQYVNMGKELYASNEIFRRHMDRCAEILQPIMGLNILDLIYPAEGAEEAAFSALKNTVNTQPVIFSIEYSLAQLWIEMGIKPVAVIGQSMGEFTAACIAGVFSLETGLTLVARRGSIMMELPGGSMLAVMIPPSEVKPFLNERLSISGMNTPSSCIISGDDESISVLKAELEDQEIYTRLLETSHAFHSHMMDPVLESFREMAKEMEYRQPTIPVLSTVTAEWTSSQEIMDPDYWVQNIRQPIRFADAVEKLFDKPEWILMEIGPGNTLSTLSKQHPSIDSEQIIIQSLKHPKMEESDTVFMQNSLGRLWSSGYNIDWTKIYDGERYKVSLPTYQFQRIRCWLDPVEGSHASAKEAADSLNGSPELLTDDEGSKSSGDIVAELTGIWEEFLGIDGIKETDDFFELGGNSLVAVQLFDELKYKLGIQLPLSALFEAPTIRDIAEMISPEQEEKQKKPKKGHTSVLVKIKSEGDQNPFFCIHGHFGNVLFFNDLAKSLKNDRPFYGVQSVGLSGEEDPLTSIEDMADRIISEMKAVQPKGPYKFGGYCYGVTVSIAIAKKLEEIGETYEPIVMIDPQPNAFKNILKPEVISAFYSSANEQRLNKHSGTLNTLSIFEKITYLGGKISHRILNLLKLRGLQIYSSVGKNMSGRMPDVFRDVEFCNDFAHRKYSKNYKDCFKADVDIILSKQVTEKFSQDPFKDWTGFTSGNMNIHLVDDDGLIMSGAMFKAPYLRGLVDVLDPILGSDEKPLVTKNEEKLRAPSQDRKMIKI